jgi:hypothetical protein
MATNKKDNEDRKRINEPIAARPLRPQGLLFLQSLPKRPKGHPLPCTISPIYRLTQDISTQTSNLRYMQPQRSFATLLPTPTNTLIPSMQPPNTALPIAITDAIALHQQAVNQLGGGHLSWAAEEGLGEGWEVLGGSCGWHCRGCRWAFDHTNADGDLLHYSAVATEPLESASMAPAAVVAASSCLRSAAAFAGLGLELWG